MTDEDVQYLMSIDYGDTVISPFYGSAIKEKKKKRREEEEPIDKSMDYSPDDQDMSHGDNLLIEEIPLEDLHDIPDESTLD